MAINWETWLVVVLMFVDVLEILPTAIKKRNDCLRVTSKTVCFSVANWLFCIVVVLICTDGFDSVTEIAIPVVLIWSALWVAVLYVTTRGLPPAQRSEVQVAL